MWLPHLQSLLLESNRTANITRWSPHHWTGKLHGAIAPMRFSVIAVPGSLKLPPRFLVWSFRVRLQVVATVNRTRHPGTDVTFARFITIPANCEPRNWATAGRIQYVSVGLRRASLRSFDSSRAVLDDKLHATLGNRAKVQHSKLRRAS